MRILQWMFVLGLWMVLTACHTVPTALPAPPVVPISFPITNDAGTAIVVGKGLILTADHVVPAQREGKKVMRIGENITEYEIVASGPGDGTTASWVNDWSRENWEAWSKDWALLKIAQPELATGSVTSIDWNGDIKPGDTVYLIGYTSGREGPVLMSVEGRVVKNELPTSSDFVFVTTAENKPYPGCSGGIVARLCESSGTMPPSLEMVGMYRGSYRQVANNGSVTLFTQLVRRPPTELKGQLDN